MLIVFIRSVGVPYRVAALYGDVVSGVISARRDTAPGILVVGLALIAKSGAQSDLLLRYERNFVAAVELKHTLRDPGLALAPLR